MSPLQAEPVVLSTKVIVATDEVGHVVTAVACPKLTEDPQVRVWPGGGVRVSVEIIGGVAVTVTVKQQEVLFPQPSVAR